MKVFSDYNKAHQYATEYAQEVKRDVGLLKTREFTSTIYQVFILPDKANRTGHELLCEVVPYILMPRSKEEMKDLFKTMLNQHPS